MRNPCAVVRAGVMGLAVVASLVVGFGLTAEVAMADAYNTRPASGVSGSALQGVFNGAMSNPFVVTGSGNDQAPYAQFFDAGGNGTASIIVELAGFAGSNTVGMYSFSNNAHEFQLFAGSDAAGDSVTIYFDYANDKVSLDGVNWTTFDLSEGFGFYLDTPQSNSFFTEDSRNASGNPQALVFQGEGGSQTITIGSSTYSLGSTDFVIAFEDLLFASSDKDFDDFVFLVRGISPVPEPATLVLLGSALAGLGVARSRRRRSAA